jgi:hypothetical protein
MHWISWAGLLMLWSAAAGAQSTSPVQSAPEQGTATHAQGTASQGQGSSGAQGSPAAATSAKHKSTKGAASGNSAGRSASAATPHSHYRPERFAGKAGSYYRLVWGIDDLVVKWGESGEVIRFNYRVLDANKAQPLNDGRNEPSLIDPERGVKLVVPAMENVGKLRQSVPPENGKSYWMVFSNKGRLVRRGDHVIVTVGGFHASGLVVD